METVRLGIIMNGGTGRMGTNQHLARSICAIRAQGGAALADGRTVMPDPLLVGRNADKVAALAKANGDLHWTTDLDAALADATSGRNDDAILDIRVPEGSKLNVQTVSAEHRRARHAWLAAAGGREWRHLHGSL